MPEARELKYPSRAEELARQHAIEWADDWQYATVHRIVRGLETEQQRAAARKGASPDFFEPPEGDGWEPNVDKHLSIREEYGTEPGRRGSPGLDARPPAWCDDGTALMQRLYWRRPAPGTRPWQAAAHLSIARPDVEGIGS